MLGGAQGRPEQNFCSRQLPSGTEYDFRLHSGKKPKKTRQKTQTNQNSLYNK